MTTHPSCRAFLPILLGLALLPSWAVALITGGEGNDPVENRGWPKGSEVVANQESRIAHWEGPPFGGGESTFEFQGKSTADLNKALNALAKIEAPVKELVLSRDAGESFWLGIGERGKDADISIDWTFVVWLPDSWNQLFNNPKSTFMADHPNFRKPLPPPRIHAYLGSERLDWEKVVVPDGVTVIDQRPKPGETPTITGTVYDLDTGEPTGGAKVTLTPNFEMDGPLPGAVTEAGGTYVLPDLPEGAYTVVASAKGYAPKRSLNYDPVKAGVKRVEDFRLSPVTTLEGAVRDPEGNPIEGARVIARNVVGKDGLGYSSAGGHLEMHTGADGKFKIEGLPHGTARLNVWIDGWYYPGSVTTSHALPPNGPVVIDMIGTGTVKGTIKRLEGRQMVISISEAAGEKIGSWGGSMNCKEGGTFEFKNVPEGEYVVGPPRGEDMKPGDPNTRTITLEAGKTVEVSIVEE